MSFCVMYCNTFPVDMAVTLFSSSLSCDGICGGETGDVFLDMSVVSMNRCPHNDLYCKATIC